jgi:hypothetical protein
VPLGRGRALARLQLRSGRFWAAGSLSMFPGGRSFSSTCRSRSSSSRSLCGTCRKLAVARAAGLVAIAIFGALMLHTFQLHLAPRVAALQLPPGAVQMIEEQQMKLARAEVPSDLSAETRHELRLAIDL